MRAGRVLTIGGALILVAASGAWTGYKARENTAQFSWFGMREGRPSFALLLNRHAWAYVTEHKGRGWTNELLDAKVHAQINALIEEGLRTAPQGCPGRWLMKTIRALPDGSMYFGAFCANPEDLEEADGDQYAKVST